MTSRLYILAAVLAVVTAATVVVADDQVMFNYQGRVRVQGTAFNGKGYFNK